MHGGTETFLGIRWRIGSAGVVAQTIEQRPAPDTRDGEKCRPDKTEPLEMTSGRRFRAAAGAAFGSEPIASSKHAGRIWPESRPEEGTVA